MILVIDNYDSFTYNLVHLVNELGVGTQVYRNDAIDVAGALALRPEAILLSPGPCTPDQAGICLELIARAPDDLAILGVCLGHQAIGQALGGKVISAKTLMHGKTSAIRHCGMGVFEGLPDGFVATRYHSLSIECATLPPDLAITAWADDGEIMGFSHVRRPLHGVQFHPESIATEGGHQLVGNFLDLAGVKRLAMI
ncbi:MAG: aminodeoxychorismate/anthranilate synthase component II [Pseudomonadota bacterium]